MPLFDDLIYHRRVWTLEYMGEIQEFYPNRERAHPTLRRPNLSHHFTVLEQQFPDKVAGF